MIWSWYVADDTQFYIVGAVILILATSHFKTATFATIALLLSSWLTTGYIALTNNHMPSLDDPLALFDKIYDKPWTRLGPYLIGMSIGYFLFKTDCKVKMSKVTTTNFPALKRSLPLSTIPADLPFRQLSLSAGSFLRRVS